MFPREYAASYFLAVPLHHIQQGMHLFGEVNLADDQEVGFGDAGAVFAGDFVTGGEVGQAQDKVAQLRAEGDVEVVAAGLNQY